MQSSAFLDCYLHVVQTCSFFVFCNELCVNAGKLNDRAAHFEKHVRRESNTAFQTGSAESRSVFCRNEATAFFENGAVEPFLHLDDVPFHVLFQFF